MERLDEIIQKGYKFSIHVESKGSKPDLSLRDLDIDVRWLARLAGWPSYLLVSIALQQWTEYRSAARRPCLKWKCCPISLAGDGDGWRR